ncbi:hypothetical protein IJJ39_00625 [Candidatus Saccharibacteria bacterium]|nr:hypothetical protein [Candidatus Saccharibacteria bacterium]
MDNKEYLEQISASVRPATKSKGKGILSSPIFKISVIGIIAFILIAILGAVLTGGRPSIKDETIELQLYVSSTMKAISDYQSDLKSSNLRSHSASLGSILSNTSRDLTNYLESTYDSAKPSSTAESDEQLHLEGLESDLFEAKINGILDRIYAHKMAYEISMIMSRESSIYEHVSDSSFRTKLESSYNSLNTLYTEFNEFSETN